MRCADVTRELAAKTSHAESGEVAAHLASCPSCQAWAQSAQRLDTLWEATRPEEPAGSFDAAWACVTQAVESRPTLPLAPARRRWVFVAVGLAQAAAVLVVGFLVAARMHGPQPAGPGPQLALNNAPAYPQPPEPPAADPLALTATCPPVEVDAGHIVFIEMPNCENVKKEVADLYGKDLYMASADMDMLNTMEALAQE